MLGIKSCLVSGSLAKVAASGSYQVTPAIELTPDVQWVKGTLGGLTGGDDAIVAGIRLNMKL